MFFVLSPSLLLSPNSFRRTRERAKQTLVPHYWSLCFHLETRLAWQNPCPSPACNCSYSAPDCLGLEAFPFAPLCVSVQTVREWCLQQPEQPFVAWYLLCFPGYLSFCNQSVELTFLQMEVVRQQWRRLCQERLHSIVARCAWFGVSQSGSTVIWKVYLQLIVHEISQEEKLLVPWGRKSDGFPGENWNAVYSHEHNSPASYWRAVAWCIPLISHLNSWKLLFWQASLVTLQLQSAEIPSRTPGV